MARTTGILWPLLGSTASIGGALLTHQGTYDPARSYVLNDVVSANGKLWKAPGAVAAVGARASLHSTATTTGVSPAAATVALPAGVAAGMTALVALSTYNGDSIPPTPANWTLVQSRRDGVGTYGVGLTIFGKTLTSGDIAAAPWQFSVPGGSQWAVQARFYSTVSSFVLGGGSSSTATAASGTVVAPSVFAVSSGALVVRFFATESGAASSAAAPTITGGSNPLKTNHSDAANSYARLSSAEVDGTATTTPATPTFTTTTSGSWSESSVVLTASGSINTASWVEIPAAAPLVG